MSQNFDLWDDEREPLPATIHSPARFLEAVPAGFDGIFDWSWTDGCFGKTRIKPMDFDGVVERNGNFLVMETKAVGKEVSQGQSMTLRALHKRGGFTIMLIYGKQRPDRFLCWHPDSEEMVEGFGVEAAHSEVAAWYQRADSIPYRQPDISLLNRRIVSLSETATVAHARLADLRKDMVDGLRAWFKRLDEIKASLEQPPK